MNRVPMSASSGGRVVIGTVVVLVLCALGTVAACVSGDEQRASHRTRPPAAPAPAGRARPSPSGPPGEPPVTSDPLAYARAFATALWSYDTRRTTRGAHLAALNAWLTSEKQYTDKDSVAAQVPSSVVWSRLRDNGQQTSAEVSEAHFPAAFTQELQDDPDLLHEAYLYAVTVTGEQTITWRGSDPGSGTETQMVTLAIQCRPRRPCALGGILPEVAP